MDTSSSFTSPWKKDLNTHYDVTEIIGGFEAVTKLRNEVFNLIIVNISIARINGVDAIRKIRDKYKDIPIIVLFDRKDLLNIKQAKAYGISTAIQYPVTSKAILNSISKYISVSLKEQEPNDIEDQDSNIKKSENYVNIENQYYEGLSAIAANQIEKAINIYTSLINLTNIKQEKWLKYIEESRFQLGQCYARLKDFMQSNKYYLDFITRFPNHNSIKEAHLYVADNYTALKDYSKASFYYKKVINMRPFDSLSTQARKLLKKISNNVT